MFNRGMKTKPDLENLQNERPHLPFPVPINLKLTPSGKIKKDILFYNLFFYICKYKMFIGKYVF